MYRGSTPLHTFTLPDELSGVQLAALYITYAQFGAVRLEKTLDDAGVTVDGNTISVKLTQEDTLGFSAVEGSNAQIQIRLRTVNGDALPSDIITVPIEAVLKDGVI